MRRVNSNGSEISTASEPDTQAVESRGTMGEAALVQSKIHEIGFGVDRLEARNEPLIAHLQATGGTASALALANLEGFRSRAESSQAASALAHQAMMTVFQDERQKHAEAWEEETKNMRCVTFDMTREEVDAHMHGMREAAKTRLETSGGQSRAQLQRIKDAMQTSHEIQKTN